MEMIRRQGVEPRKSNQEKRKEKRDKTHCHIVLGTCYLRQFPNIRNRSELEGRRANTASDYRTGPWRGQLDGERALMS